MRFTWTLPLDNSLPFLVGNRIEIGIPPAHPFLNGEWQTSDRPPLQTAVVLAARAFPAGGVDNLAYQIVGTVCQLGWVPALYALLREIGASRRQQIYAWVGCAFAGFFLINSLYVWPKLLAAWLFILAIALLHRVAKTPPGTPSALPPAAILIGLSLLSHGGTAFSLAALPVLWRLWRLRPIVAARELAIAGLLFSALLSPWVVYQQSVDPPGNRLVKEHLAGVVTRDDRSGLSSSPLRSRPLRSGAS